MWIVILITLILIAAFTRLFVIFKDQIKFFITGHDEGFKANEIILLWKLAKETDIEEPATLYYSVNALNGAIQNLVSAARAKGEENSQKIQDFLSKLYKYRTKVDISHENKRGLESSKYLDKGQRLRIILKGKGVFASEILNNGHEMIIKLPLQKNTLKLEGKEWVGHDISVYLWRKGDAGYVFDTKVTNSGVFNGQNVIYLAQSNQLERAQKRRSIRSECKINGSLYFIDAENLDFTAVEVEPGYKCLIEDISEDGAMIRIGGKGQNDIQIKIQFELDEKLIVMFGVIRAVEYNAKLNQSRLHFECLHLEKEMKNTILNYVYKIISDDKKEVLEALSQTEEDELEDKQQSSSNNGISEDTKDNPVTNENELQNDVDAELNVQDLAKIDVLDSDEV